MTNKYAAQARESRERRQRERSCTNKVAYSTYTAAADNGAWDVYRCNYGTHWHRTGSFRRFLHSLIATRRTRRG